MPLSDSAESEPECGGRGTFACPYVSPFLARGLVRRAEKARMRAISSLQQPMPCTRDVILPWRDGIPDVYVQVIALLGDVASRRAAFAEAATILGEGTAYLDARRGRFESDPSPDMAESDIGYARSTRALRRRGRPTAILRADQPLLADCTRIHHRTSFAIRFRRSCNASARNRSRALYR